MTATGKQRGGITGKGFLPGRSGNPGGRPKGLSTVLRENTLEGQELARFWLGVMRDRRRGMAIRLKASELVAAYGFGKPSQPFQTDTPPMHVHIHLSEAPANPAKPVEGRRVDGRPAGRLPS